MKYRVRIDPMADHDMAQIGEEIAADNLDAGIRFISAARKTIEMAGNMPGAGAQFITRNKRLQDLRKWPIRGFRNYLVFYRFANDEVRIVRVIHGARDIPTLLEDDE